MCYLSHWCVYIIIMISSRGQIHKLRMRWIQLLTGLVRSLGEMFFLLIRFLCDCAFTLLWQIVSPEHLAFLMRDCAGFQWRRRTGRSPWYLMLTTMRTSRWPTHCITESESDDRISLQCMRTLRIVKFHPCLFEQHPPSVLSSGWDQWRVPASSSRGEPSQFWLCSRGSFNCLAWWRVDFEFTICVPYVQCQLSQI